MTQQQLDDIILPEQAMQEPKYSNIKKLLESNRNDLIKKGVDSSALQDLELPIQNKIKNNKVVNQENNNSSGIKKEMSRSKSSLTSLSNKNIPKFNRNIKYSTQQNNNSNN